MFRFARRDLRVTITSYDGRAAMRWCVSIGAVLVAGAMAGGDVAGIAAPGPRTGRTTSSVSATSTGRQGSPSVRRRRTGARRRCFLFDGHGRTRAPARGLRAGHRLQGVSAGAEERPERQDFGDLFRMGGIERPEDHHSLAGDRRSGNRRRRRQRDHEDADPPGVAHLDLGRDQFRDAAVRREPASRLAARDRYFRRRPQQQRRRRSTSRAMRRWRRGSSSTACRSW